MADQTLLFRHDIRKVGQDHQWRVNDFAWAKDAKEASAKLGQPYVEFGVDLPFGDADGFQHRVVATSAEIADADANHVEDKILALKAELHHLEKELKVFWISGHGECEPEDI